ncbi:hypothetical protein D3C80_1729680 [compost metagenome]
MAAQQRLRAQLLQHDNIVCNEAMSPSDQRMRSLALANARFAAKQYADARDIQANAVHRYFRRKRLEQI